MMTRIVCSLLSSTLAAALAQAGPADPRNGGKAAWVDPGWRKTLDRCAVTFDEHGLSTTVCEFEFSSLDRKGAEAISQQVFTRGSLTRGWSG